MELNAIYVIWLREMKRFSRDKFRFIGGITTPLIYLAILGLGLKSSFQFADPNFDYLHFILPGIIGMSLLFTSIFSGISVIYERQFGFLKELLVAPVSRASIVLGKISGSTTIAFLNGAILLIIGLLFGLIPLQNITILSVLIALLFMILIASSFVSLGLALAAKMNSMEGFQFVMSFLVMPVFLLSGVFFPINNLPPWMAALAHIDPLMYGVDGIRGALLGSSLNSIWLNLAVLIIFNIAMILITKKLFERI